jgi:hypothetical protein
MRRIGVVWVCCLVTGLFWIPVASAQGEKDPEFSIGGLLFGDLYHVASFHTDEGEGATGLVLRRGYLTFNADFSEKLFGRLRFEVNQSGEFETYTFDIGFKDLYLDWTLGRQHLLVGLSPTPTFDLIESIWGLRYLARTPMDLQGVASRGTGISANGPLNTSGTLSYRAMVSTGLDFGNETSDGPKFMGALTWNPAPGWTVDLYADYENLTGPTGLPTLQAFASYETETWRWGAQYSNQGWQDDEPLELASTYAVGRVGPRTSLVGRVDRIFKPSPKGDNISYLPIDPSVPATLYLAGVEFRLNSHLFITPNTVVVDYDRNDQGVRPRTDFYLRLTLFLNLE